MCAGSQSQLLPHRAHYRLSFDVRRWIINETTKGTDNWLQVYSPVPITCVYLCYLIIIWVGPKLTARQQPVSLRACPACLQFCHGLAVCLHVVRGTPMARVCWWFYFSKVMELSDTVFSHNSLLFNYQVSHGLFCHLPLFPGHSKYKHMFFIFSFLSVCSVVTIHPTYNLAADSTFPDSMNVVVLAYSLSLVVLVSNFYYHSYLTKSKI
uniref:very-long-chain 3-oxoacyl-CoA synthase n=1 Tax=Kryptolebias marmoratus TaxID=37003 RepID=A0A3Q3GYU3_KRYMA